MKKYGIHTKCVLLNCDAPSFDMRSGNPAEGRFATKSKLDMTMLANCRQENFKLLAVLLQCQFTYINASCNNKLQTC